jgi:chromosomal replication initiation ATPase DnaA
VARERGARDKGLNMHGIDEEAGPDARQPSDIAKIMVAQVYDVAVEDLRSDRRCNPRTALARQIAMYLSHIVLRMSFAQIALAFGRNRSTACHALHHIEDLRDDPELDRTLLQLEVLLRQTVGGAA